MKIQPIARIVSIFVDKTKVIFFQQVHALTNHIKKFLAPRLPLQYLTDI